MAGKKNLTSYAVEDETFPDSPATRARNSSASFELADMPVEPGARGQRSLASEESMSRRTRSPVACVQRIWRLPSISLPGVTWPRVV